MDAPTMNRFQNDYNGLPYSGYGMGGIAQLPLSTVAEKSLPDGMNATTSAVDASADRMLPPKKQYSARCRTNNNRKRSSATFDNDAPLVTPTVNSKMSLSKAFLLKNFSAPPLAAGELHKSAGGDDRAQQQPQREASPASISPTSVVPQNPLDLLSLVSTHVAKNQETNNMNTKMYQQQQQDQGNRRPATPARQQQWQATSKQQSKPAPQDPHDSTSSSSPPPYLGERSPTTGLRHGRGLMRYPNGCTYSGTFHNDRRHGYGECHYPNGCLYAGFWSHGKRDGIGKMIYVDRGDIYEGEWKEDQRHGRGIYHRADGRADVCRYVNHEAVGEGTQWSPNREFVVRLVDGVNWGEVSVGRALEICQRIGVPGVPKQVFPEFRTPRAA